LRFDGLVNTEAEKNKHDDNKEIGQVITVLLFHVVQIICHAARLMRIMPAKSAELIKIAFFMFLGLMVN
jgi:hypothetical protein